MDYLQKNKTTCCRKRESLWDAAGGKTSGTWERGFWQGHGRRRGLHGLAYARYMNRITELGKKELPIPVYVNAWLVQPQTRCRETTRAAVRKPTITTSGAPAQPAIDILAPDIYLTNFAESPPCIAGMATPVHPGDARRCANAFYAIGQLNAQMFSPFGIERQVSADGPLAAAYGVLKELTPLDHGASDQRHHESGDDGCGHGRPEGDHGNYVFELAMGGGRGAAPRPRLRQRRRKVRCGGASSGWGGGFGGGGGRGGRPRRVATPSSYRRAPTISWVAGAKPGHQNSIHRRGNPMASLAAVEEGKIRDGAW